MAACLRRSLGGSIVSARRAVVPQLIRLLPLRLRRRPGPFHGGRARHYSCSDDADFAAKWRVDQVDKYLDNLKYDQQGGYEKLKQLGQITKSLNSAYKDTFLRNASGSIKRTVAITYGFLVGAGGTYWNRTKSS